MPNNLLLRKAEAHRKVLGNVATLAAADTVGAIKLSTKLTDGYRLGALRETIPPIVEAYGNVAATVSADFYDELRVGAGVKKGYTAIAPTRDWAKISEPIAGFAIKRFITEAPLQSTISLIAGAVMSEIFTTARETMQYNADRDSVKVTYQRVTRPNACDFCIYMAVGFEGKSSQEEYKDFHNHCMCVDVAVFENQTWTEPEHYGEFRDNLEEARGRIRNLRDIAEEQDGGLRKKEFFAKYPESAITTKNLMKQVRQVKNGNPLVIPDQYSSR
jgi:hypothetical protein